MQQKNPGIRYETELYSTRMEYFRGLSVTNRQSSHIMLSSFNQLGYRVEWRVINAAEYGFPQRRRRVFIFATKKDDKLALPYSSTTPEDLILKQGFFAQEFHVDPERSSDKAKRIEISKDLIELTEHFSDWFENSGILLDGSAYSMKTVPIECAMMNLSEILEKDVDKKYFLTGDTLEKWKYMKGAKAEERTTLEGYKYKFTEGAIPFPDPLDRPARTMLTSESSKNRSTHVIEDPQNRGLRLLTPIECERLDGFPDDWTKTGMPEKFRYFCMGNALVVGLIERMGKRIADLNRRG